jgi:hypothetical protein
MGESGVSALDNSEKIMKISEDVLNIIPEEYELPKIRMTFPEELNPT